MEGEKCAGLFSSQLRLKKPSVENDQLGVFQNPGVPAQRRNHREDVGRFNRPTVRQAVSEQGLFLERRRPDRDLSLDEELQARKGSVEPPPT
jgi:hypothetical protein